MKRTAARQPWYAAS